MAQQIEVPKFNSRNPSIDPNFRDEETALSRLICPTQQVGIQQLAVRLHVKEGGRTEQTPKLFSNFDTCTVTHVHVA